MNNQAPFTRNLEVQWAKAPQETSTTLSLARHSNPTLPQLCIIFFVPMNTLMRHIHWLTSFNLFHTSHFFCFTKITGGSEDWHQLLAFSAEFFKTWRLEFHPLGV